MNAIEIEKLESIEWSKTNDMTQELRGYTILEGYKCYEVFAQYTNGWGECVATFPTKLECMEFITNLSAND